MKLSKISTIIFTGALACSLTLTGCNEKNNKSPEVAQVVKSTTLEPNNWNCRGYQFYRNPVHRLKQQEQEGKLKDAELFLNKCKELKLGVYNPIVKQTLHNDNSPKGAT